MKLPPSSLLASISLAGLRTVSVSAIDIGTNVRIDSVGSDIAVDAAATSRVHAHTIDTGILNILDADVNAMGAPLPLFHRLLQTESDSNSNSNSNSSSTSNCPASCSSALCDCVAQYGYADPCFEQLNDVCTGSAGVTIDSCVVPEYVYYYQNVYCPFAACRVGGGSYEQCNCDSYVDFCGIYQKKEGYENDAKTLQYCSIASCCLGKSDDEGRSTCLTRSFQSDAVNDANTTIAADDADADHTHDGQDQNGTVTNEGGQEDELVAETSNAGQGVETVATTNGGFSEPIDFVVDDATTATVGDREVPVPNSAYSVNGSAISAAVGTFFWLVIWG